jgi:hypothetical protein
MREAVRYLAPGDAERLMAAYREHRPADWSDLGQVRKSQ